MLFLRWWTGRKVKTSLLCLEANSWWFSQLITWATWKNNNIQLLLLRVVGRKSRTRRVDFNITNSIIWHLKETISHKKISVGQKPATEVVSSHDRVLCSELNAIHVCSLWRLSVTNLSIVAREYRSEAAHHPRNLHTEPHEVLHMSPVQNRNGIPAWVLSVNPCVSRRTAPASAWHLNE